MKRTSHLLTALALTAGIAAISGCGKSTDVTSPNSLIDTNAPAAPAGLAMTPQFDCNQLTWDASASPDVVKYEVYQYQPDPTRENAYVKVGETTNSSYPFYNIETMDTYVRVAAVDAADNHSALSAELSVHMSRVDNAGSTRPTDGNGKHIEE